MVLNGNGNEMMGCMVPYFLLQIKSDQIRLDVKCALDLDSDLDSYFSCLVLVGWLYRFFLFFCLLSFFLVRFLGVSRFSKYQ